MKNLDFWVQTFFMFLFIGCSLHLRTHAQESYGFLYNTLLLTVCAVLTLSVWQFISCCREMRTESDYSMFHKIYFNVSILMILMYFVGALVQNEYCIGVGILLTIGLAIGYYVLTAYEYIAKK